MYCYEFECDLTYMLNHIPENQRMEARREREKYLGVLTEEEKALDKVRSNEILWKKALFTLVYFGTNKL